jgi:predicted nucleic acid-binding protein
MNGIFVDTGGWYAAIDRQDRSHEVARHFLENNQLPLVTTDYVMDETVTFNGVVAPGWPINLSARSFQP